MNFSEINYNSEQQKLLNHFDEIGIVLETVIMLSDEPIEDVYIQSKSAALKGMEILAERHTQWFQKTNPELNIEDYCQILMSSDKELTGNEITFPEFIGAGYELQTSTVKLFSYDVDRQIISHDVTDGFAYALLNPPYSLRICKSGTFATKEYQDTETESYNKLISSFLSTILEISNFNKIAHLKLFRWSDNWSNYFDAGKEWWGTFCWTIYNTQNNTITFIAASATD